MTSASSVMKSSSVFANSTKGRVVRKRPATSESAATAALNPARKSSSNDAGSLMEHYTGRLKVTSPCLYPPSRVSPSRLRAGIAMCTGISPL